LDKTKIFSTTIVQFDQPLTILNSLSHETIHPRLAIHDGH